MTNLLEKTLLIGFGIFTLITFASVIIPFIDEIFNYNKNQREELNEYLEFIDEIDVSIKYISNNPSQTYIKQIFYPSKLNITFQGSSIQYHFYLGNNSNSKIMIYSEQFHFHSYQNFPSRKYNLNVSYLNSMIKVLLE